MSGLVGGLMGASLAMILVVFNLGDAGAIALATIGVTLAVAFGVVVWLKTWSITRDKRKSTAQP